QTEQPGSARQTAPSVAVTWGGVRYALTADLGNNAAVRYFEQEGAAIRWLEHELWLYEVNSRVTHVN
ncbi:hypothetical protein ACE1BH_20260, partial [Aeromonas jandaei]